MMNKNLNFIACNLKTIIYKFVNMGPGERGGGQGN